MNGKLVLEVSVTEYVKVSCVHTQCVHNLAKSEGFFCNLKNIDISSEGKCVDFLLARAEE